MFRRPLIFTKLKRFPRTSPLAVCCLIVIILLVCFLRQVLWISDVVKFQNETKSSAKCPLLDLNGQHNPSQVFQETVYLRGDLHQSPKFDDRFLSSFFSQRTHSFIDKKLVNPETSNRCHNASGRRILINYSDAGCCRFVQQSNCNSGIRVGGFDACIAYSNWSINEPNFVNKNCHLLSERLWLWKPYLVFQALSALDYGDLLFYSDSGSEFADNIDTTLICLQQKYKQDIVVFSLDFPEYRFTKEDAFVLMNCQSDEYRYSPQRLASFILMKKTPESVRFVSEWLTYAQDGRILSNEPSQYGWDFLKYFFFDPNTYRLRTGAHRNDQSILSLLSKKWNIDSWPDPSQYGERLVGSILKNKDDRFKTLRGRILIYHHRKRS